LVKRRYRVLVERSAATDITSYGDWRKSQIYKMWALLLVIMPDKLD